MATSCAHNSDNNNNNNNSDSKQAPAGPAELPTWSWPPNSAEQYLEATWSARAPR